jgi:hypothetical protein
VPQLGSLLFHRILPSFRHERHILFVRHVEKPVLIMTWPIRTPMQRQDKAR